jgi:Tfp pilus assembly protein PilF
MNWPARQTMLLFGVVATAAAGCANVDLQSWNPVSNLGPRRYSADTKFKIARVQEQQGQLAKARQIYSELYRRNPNNVEVCQRLAVVSARLGDTQQSDRYFNEALNLAPNRASALTDYGYAKLSNKEYAAAEALLRRALAISPGDKRAMNNLGIALGYQGKHEQALATFRRVVPEAQAQANLAFLHVQRGEGKMAVERYTRALALDKNLHGAAHALLQLAEMEQRYLRSERGRRQLARMKAKHSQQALAADASRSNPGKQNVKLATSVGPRPLATKPADFVTEPEPRPATKAAASKNDSAPREVVKQPSSATTRAVSTMDAKPATGVTADGDAGASHPSAQRNSIPEYQARRASDAFKKTERASYAGSPQIGRQADDSSPNAPAVGGRDSSPPFPVQQTVENRVSPVDRPLTAAKYEPADQPVRNPVKQVDPFAENERRNDANAPQPERQRSNQSWAPAKKVRTPEARWHPSHPKDHASKRSAEPNPFEAVGDEPASLPADKPAAPSATAAERPTGRVKLSPAPPAEPARFHLQPAPAVADPARIRLTPANDKASSGRVRLTPGE